MKKTLYLMRHGETMFNVQKRIQGWSDSPLTENGKQQALNVKAYFEKEGIHFDHAYSSTSERCVDTLELITDMPYTRYKGLKEMSFGMFEGESERLNPATPKDYETFFVSYGGESSNDVGLRMMETLTMIMKSEDHTTVFAVSHGGACFNFLRHLQDPSEELQKGFGNCNILVFSYEDEFKLEHIIRLN